MDNTTTALIILIAAALFYLGAWAREIRRWRKAQRKTRASEPVDFIDFTTYDSKAHRKIVRRDLHESMREGGKRA
jgi:hypothetical protein